MSELLCPCCGQPLPATQTVAQRIRLAREQAGLSQTEVGQRLARPLRHAAISELERGKVRIKLDVLEEIAGLLNVPLSWLIDGSMPEGEP